MLRNNPFAGTPIVVNKVTPVTAACTCYRMTATVAVHYFCDNTILQEQPSDHSQLGIWGCSAEWSCRRTWNCWIDISMTEFI